uniref:RRM domain-containing protein n=1 Tax=Angiostrongylus cantonensis TaxID=6313 RepID=A0A158P9J6_ANGCA
MKQKPVTTVFVGNISEKCSNEFMQQMLQECGKVTTWKRIQGSNGKFQAFGFCDFEEPEGTLRALRVLNDFQIGEKKLVVKAEPKVREELRSWAIQNRKDNGKPELHLKEDELPADDDDLKKDEEVRLKILAWIDSDHPQLVTLAEGDRFSGCCSLSLFSKMLTNSSSYMFQDDERDRRRRRSRSDSRSRSRNEKRSLRRSKSPKHKRRRRSTSFSGSSESNSGSDSSESRSRSRSRERTPPKKRRERERSLSRSSEDSEDAREKRNLKKQIKEKEQAYVSRLTKWEARERQKAKQYEREERREKDRRDILKEAKKLKHFLEDYDDEKDDPKYYKSSSLFQRKRDFEREREADSKDRLREQQEIEELRKQILAENKDVQDVDEEARRRHFEKEEAAMRRLREDSGSPNPHQPLGQRDGNDDSSSSSADSDDEDDDKSIDEKSVGDEEEDTKTQKITMRGASSSASIQTLQRVDDEEEEGGRKHLRPFEITQEERMETLTTDEKKRMVRDLINNIPTTKDELFAHVIDWRYVDRSLIEQRVRPWVAKKIMEFLGEEEGALVDFVCEKVASKTSPDRILGDIAMILDEDAEVFVVKMWRLLIYESEAKKLGLVVPRSNQ